MKKNQYTGNYPNSANYDSNIPIGFWDWDREDDDEDTEEDIPDENMEDEE